MISTDRSEKQKTVFWLLLGVGFAAVLVGTLAHRSFFSGMGTGLILVALVSQPLLRFKSGLRR
jgi:hypothetical protein